MLFEVLSMPLPPLIRTMPFRSFFNRFANRPPSRFTPCRIGHVELGVFAATEQFEVPDVVVETVPVSVVDAISGRNRPVEVFPDGSVEPLSVRLFEVIAAEIVRFSIEPIVSILNPVHSSALFHPSFVNNR